MNTKFFDFLDKYYYNHKGLRFVLFLLFVVYYATGCVSTGNINPPSSRVGVSVEEKMAGVALKATGDVTVVEETTATTFSSAKSHSAAKLELALAREVTKQVEAMARARAAEARAANPCSSWFMAPSYCYEGNTYGSGGRVVTIRGGGRGYSSSKPQGVPPSGNTGPAIVITGGGSAGGSSTGGAQKGGGVVTIKK